MSYRTRQPSEPDGETSWPADVALVLLMALAWLASRFVPPLPDDREAPRP